MNTLKELRANYESYLRKIALGILDRVAKNKTVIFADEDEAGRLMGSPLFNHHGCGRIIVGIEIADNGEYILNFDYGEFTADYLFSELCIYDLETICRLDNFAPIKTKSSSGEVK